MKQKNPLFVENEVACLCEVVHNTGRNDSNWPPQPIVNRIEVSLDGRGTKWEEFHYRAKVNEHDPLARWQSRKQAAWDVTEEAISTAEARVRALWQKHDADTVKGRTTWQYRIIAAEAQRVGWPTNYQDDLIVHDAYWLAHAKPEVFLWCLRENGTHLHCTNDSRDWRVAEVRQNGDRAYYYEVGQSAGGGRLRKLAAEQYAAYKFKEA